ncbi:hypothetical protein MCOR28_011751 [Pyricularia oryzae]|nr:hypothetical protein MCOR28_011751 [Pyricularia oryzae]
MIDDAVELLEPEQEQRDDLPRSIPAESASAVCDKVGCLADSDPQLEGLDTALLHAFNPASYRLVSHQLGDQ